MNEIDAVLEAEANEATKQGRHPVAIVMRRDFFEKLKSNADALCHLQVANEEEKDDTLKFSGMNVLFSDHLPEKAPYRFIFPEFDRRCLYCHAFISSGQVCNRCKGH